MPLIAAGSIALFGAAFHGIGGEALVIRKLATAELPKATKTMIHVTWHITTVGFFAVGAGLVLAGSVVEGDTARGMSLFAAATATGFAALTVGMAAASGPFPRSLTWHPAPALLTLAAVLAWWGAL